MEHPRHGASPDLKLVTQPSAQLPLMFAIFSSFAVGDIVDADGVAAVGGVAADTMLRAATRCFGLSGLATCFGASTTTLGSAAVVPPERVAVCDIAVPLRPHSSAIDRVATARSAAKSDENLMAMSSQMPGQQFRPGTGGYHVPGQAVKLRGDPIRGILRNQLQSGDLSLMQSGGLLAATDGNDDR
ncbi:MAG TPA: hypothetical protein VGM09_32510 [Bradyrhizobium sp.]